MIDQLIHTIANELQVPQGNKEPEDHWKRRVLYSSIGLHMLASSYDYDNDSMFDDSLIDDSLIDDNVSMQRILNRGQHLSEVYRDFFELEAQELAEYIRALYIKTGYLLHTANRLTYPGTSCASYGNLYLVRGVEPWKVGRMSGLGTCSYAAQGAESSVECLFHLEEKDILSWYRQFSENLQWRVISDLPSDIEYINIIEPANRGYWTTRVPKKGTVLCRSANPGERIYRLLRIGTSLEQCILPSWRTEDGEYLRIAIALRVLAGNPPAAAIRRDGAIIHITSSYLLPSFEQNFFELFSWPGQRHSRWNRIISAQLLGPMIDIFKRFGFTIQEDI